MNLSISDPQIQDLICYGEFTEHAFRSQNIFPILHKILFLNQGYSLSIFVKSIEGILYNLLMYPFSLFKSNELKS